MTYVEIMHVYAGSSGDQTKALYAKLEAMGPEGFVAMNLFRACKCSERAKGYRRRAHRDEAYRRKQWSMGLLADCLIIQAAPLGIRWGWAVDPNQTFHNQLLYIDIPTGQVSFHTETRGPGPDYPGEWDKVRAAGPGRICRWIAAIMRQESVTLTPEEIRA